MDAFQRHKDKRGGCKLGKGNFTWIEAEKILLLSVIQHCTRLSQDVMEQFRDIQHLVGEGTEPPHLSLMPVKERNYKYV